MRILLELTGGRKNLQATQPVVYLDKQTFITTVHKKIYTHDLKIAKFLLLIDLNSTHTKSVDFT